MLSLEAEHEMYHSPALAVFSQGVGGGPAGRVPYKNDDLSIGTII